MEDSEAQENNAKYLSELLEREIKTTYGDKWVEDTPEINKSIRDILELSFGITLNANDFFWLATAAALTIDNLDLHWIIPIYDKYGDEGLNACMAYIAEMLPLEYYQTENFKKAYAELEEIRPAVWSEF